MVVVELRSDLTPRAQSRAVSILHRRNDHQQHSKFRIDVTYRRGQEKKEKKDRAGIERNAMYQVQQQHATTLRTTQIIEQNTWIPRGHIVPESHGCDIISAISQRSILLLMMMQERLDGGSKAPELLGMAGLGWITEGTAVQHQTDLLFGS